jgi:pimeloyl-ACP methyl ester carboxylesterase
MQGVVRIDRTLGTRERIAFVPRDADSQLFTCLHEPAQAPIGAALMCSSVLADFVSNYQREVHLARRLAGAGVMTLRFHPSGMGDSDGDPAAVTLQTLHEDAAWARDLLKSFAGDVPISFIGVRWGALIAAAAARSMSNAGSNNSAPLVLIEPINDFRRFFREAWRSRAMSALAASDAAAKKQKLVDVLAAQGFADIVGNVLHRPLYESTDNREALAEFDGLTGDVLVVQFQGKEVRPDLRTTTERLRSGGAAVDTRIVDVEESWWFRSGPRIVLDPELDEVVTTWLVEHLSRSLPSLAGR